jgi:hypothetical protein
MARNPAQGTSARSHPLSVVRAHRLRHQAAGDTQDRHAAQGADGGRQQQHPQLGPGHRGLPGNHAPKGAPSWRPFPGRAPPTTCPTTTASCSPSRRPKPRSCRPSAASTAPSAVTATVFEWQTVDRRASSANNVALEGAAAPTGAERSRANVSNVVEIHHSAIEVSYTKLAARGTSPASTSRPSGTTSWPMSWPSRPRPSWSPWPWTSSRASCRAPTSSRRTTAPPARPGACCPPSPPTCWPTAARGRACHAGHPQRRLQDSVRQRRQAPPGQDGHHAGLGPEGGADQRVRDPDAERSPPGTARSVASRSTRS